jgi:hypothetical protein
LSTRYEAALRALPVMHRFGHADASELRAVPQCYIF